MKFFEIGFEISGSDDDTEEILMAKFEEWLDAIPKDTNRILFDCRRCVVRHFVNITERECLASGEDLIDYENELKEKNCLG